MRYLGMGTTRNPPRGAGEFRVIGVAQPPPPPCGLGATCGRLGPWARLLRGLMVALPFPPPCGLGAACGLGAPFAGLYLARFNGPMGSDWHTQLLAQPSTTHEPPTRRGNLAIWHDLDRSDTFCCHLQRSSSQCQSIWLNLDQFMPIGAHRAHFNNSTQVMYPACRGHTAHRGEDWGPSPQGWGTLPIRRGCATPCTRSPPPRGGFWYPIPM